MIASPSSPRRVLKRARGFGLGRRRPKAQGHLTGPGVEREEVMSSFYT